jgi:hypothetical protein
MTQIYIISATNDKVKINITSFTNNDHFHYSSKFLNSSFTTLVQMQFLNHIIIMAPNNTVVIWCDFLRFFPLLVVRFHIHKSMFLKMNPAYPATLNSILISRPDIYLRCALSISLAASWSYLAYKTSRIWSDRFSLDCMGVIFILKLIINCNLNFLQLIQNI